MPAVPRRAVRWLPKPAKRSRRYLRLPGKNLQPAAAGVPPERAMNVDPTGVQRSKMSRQRTAIVGLMAAAIFPGDSAGASLKPGSPYCREHHALCHVAEGSIRGRRRLREAEALANAVGGRQGRPARTPPEPVLRRLENVARGFARPRCSCIVPSEDK